MLAVTWNPILRTQIREDCKLYYPFETPFTKSNSWLILGLLLCLPPTLMLRLRDLLCIYIKNLNRV